MHPFWYSASPEVQRRLISLFILSLAPKSPITTLSPSPTSAAANFTSELEYTRSPHDVAAVLRWALRHLRLEGDSFGRDSDPWKWYQAFVEAERTKSYPLNAFSDALVPQLPPSHHQLLVATLDIVSSLASHSENNGISGSKLSKLFGLWLLSAKRSQDDDDWTSFYARWERAGRILEHLFLAYVRYVGSLILFWKCINEGLGTKWYARRCRCGSRSSRRAILTKAKVLRLTVISSPVPASLHAAMTHSSSASRPNFWIRRPRNPSRILFVSSRTPSNPTLRL